MKKPTNMPTANKIAAGIENHGIICPREEKTPGLLVRVDSFRLQRARQIEHQYLRRMVSKNSFEILGANRPRPIAYKVVYRGFVRCVIAHAHSSSFDLMRITSRPPKRRGPSVRPVVSAQYVDVARSLDLALDAVRRAPRRAWAAQHRR